MAIGDQVDMQSRIRRLLPVQWFPDDAPILSAVLSGIASVKSFLYELIGYAQLQARIRTATGGWLDLVAIDFFGTDALRRAGQSDTSFRAVILANLFRERATRRALISVLTDLTGVAPSVFEPSRVQDTGAYRAPSLGYGVAGGYGSLLLPYQAFVSASRPAGSGIPSVAGYGIPSGGYGVPSRAEYASIGDVEDAVTDADIYAAVDGVKPVGTIMWVRIGSGTQAPTTPANFSLLIGGRPINFGSTRTPIRLLGWQL